MILNIALMLVTMGWTVNTAVFQCAPRMSLKWSMINAVLATASAVWLIVRLS